MYSIDFGYIIGIEIENIRGFKNLKLNLWNKENPRMLSVIIGRNGTGKSTLLRCIALGLCHESDASALIAEAGGQLVSEFEKSGAIELVISDTNGKKIGKIRLQIGNKGGRDIIIDREVTFSESNLFVCGYGAGRGNIGSSQSSRYRVMDSVATLFDYRRNLVDNELMLRRLEDYLGSSRYEKTMKGIKRVLGLGLKHRIHYAKGGGVRISGPGIGKDIPLDGWADGYRLTFNWIIDLYGWAMQADAVTDSGGVRGILLIDEIDQHLHPAMQWKLLSELRKTLPEMQVFATTHSPMTALGTESENIIALHHEDNEIKITSVPDLTGYSIDDALVEEALFGTELYSENTQQKLRRHRKLSSKPPDKRSMKELAEIRKLAIELDPSKLPGHRKDPIAKKLDELAKLLKKEKKYDMG